MTARATRRGLLALAPAAALAPAMGLLAPAGATPHPDAELIALCAQHAVNWHAYNTQGGMLEVEDDPLWAAYERTCEAINDAKPRTVEGMLAKARAAKIEARCPGGKEEPEGCPAGRWAWDLVGDLIRLHGGAA